MKFHLIIAFSLMLLIPITAYSFETDNLELQGKSLKKNTDSQIYLKFDNGRLETGYITINDNDGEGGDNSKIILDNPRIKQTKYGILIIDDNRNLIFGKEKPNGNLLFVSLIKHNEEKQRLIFNVQKEIKPINDKPLTRDLLAEFENNLTNNENQNNELETFKEKMLREKQEKLDKELKEFQKNQEELFNNKELQKSQQLEKLDKHTKELLDQVKSNTKTGKELRAELEKPKKPNETQLSKNQDNKIKMIVKFPHKLEFKNEFALSGHVFDPKINKHNNYSFKDGKISDVKIKGKILDSNNKIIHSFNELSSNNGYFATKYFIPENSAIGEYSINLNAEKTINKKTVNHSIEDSFFVTEINIKSTNLKPFALVNADQIIYHNFFNDNIAELVLNGTGSYDPEKRPLRYNWKLLNPVNDTIKLLEPMNKIEQKIEIQNVKQKDVFDFSLIVNDGSKDSDSKTTRITAINDTLKINSGTLNNFEFKGHNENFESEITTMDYPINDGIGYNLHIAENKINYGKINMTITQNGQTYDIINSDILTGIYNEGKGVDIIAVNGSLNSFNFESGQINDYSIEGKTDSFDLVDGTAFNLHKIKDDVFSGLVNATVINGTIPVYDLHFVNIELGSYTDGFFDFTGSNGMIEELN